MCLGLPSLIPIANCEDGKYRPIKKQRLGSQKLQKKTLFQSSYKIVLLISKLCYPTRYWKKFCLAQEGIIIFRQNLNEYLEILYLAPAQFCKVKCDGSESLVKS